MLCDICGREGDGSAELQKLTAQIENIPMVSCPHCGESYFTADTLHQIEHIKLHHKSFAVERPVPVAKFA